MWCGCLWCRWRATHRPRFIRACIERVFRLLPITTNYFWTCYLRGGYTRANCPEYLRPANLAALRSGLLDRLEIRTDTVSGLLASDERPFSRFVLLDHQDWMASHAPQALREEWELILANARPGAKVLLRSASDQIDFIPADIQDRLEFLPDNYLRTVNLVDRVGTYGSVHCARIK